MDSENPQNTADALEKIELDGMNCIKEVMQKMYTVWDEFGLESNPKLQRAIKVWDHVHCLLREIWCEENNLHEEMKERIQNYTTKIMELSKALSLSPKEINGSLITREMKLRQELDKLTKLRNERLKAYQELKNVALKYCRILNLSEDQLPSIAGVPSEDDLKKLEQHLTQLKIEKEKRHTKFCWMKKELTTILETTEIVPESIIKKDILSEKDFPLSNETFKALEEAISKAQAKKSEIEALKKELVDKLSLLWQRLKVEENKRVEFLSKHGDCRLSTLKSIERELERCENIKKDNIKMFIGSLREELNQLWSKCFASEHQKRLFTFYSAPEMTDEVLMAFDAEVDKWKKYYEDVKHILKKIDKRQELYELAIMFENKANDPNRFHNRKGNLLQEEKERNKLQRDLPALENAIFNDIKTYEDDKCTPFLYYGEDYRAFITNQWEARKAQKEGEKLERQKQHYLQLQNEVTIGTPMKRPLMTTPKSAPSKLFKSSVGFSIQRTPLINHSKRVVPNTVGKLMTRSIQQNSFRPNAIQKKDQKVLREKNKLMTSKIIKTSPNGTTYTDFANALNSTARCSSRSSVLSTKKPGGTRISLNKSQSKRKSVSKPTRKSARNINKVTSNLTPARGKFGLPFLI